MKKRYTIGVMIGNANSPHTMDLMQGIFHAAQSMDVNVILFLGIHSSYYYKSYFGEDVEDDYDYQFNAAYDYQAFADLDVLVIAYGSLCIFLDEKRVQLFWRNIEISHVFFSKKETKQGHLHPLLRTIIMECMP